MTFELEKKMQRGVSFDPDKIGAVVHYIRC